MNKRYFNAIALALAGSMTGTFLCFKVSEYFDMHWPWYVYVVNVIFYLIWYTNSLIQKDCGKVLHLLHEFELSGTNIDRAKKLLIEHGGVPVFIINVAVDHYKQERTK